MSELPTIIVSSLDLSRLEALLAGLADSPEAEALQTELDRATVVAPQQVPTTVVTMNSTVRFAVEQTGEEFEKTLCYPHEAATTKDGVSVLAPIGSALLGLAVGQEIEWPLPGGKLRRVRIMDVTYQPERSGNYRS